MNNKKLIEKEIKFYFPKIPDSDLKNIIRNWHRFKSLKGDGFCRALKCVTAYIRHTYTTYDSVCKGIDRRTARSVVQKKIITIQEKWGRKPGRILKQENRDKFLKVLQSNK